MTAKEKIREELARLKEETSIGLSEHENGVEQGRMEIINALSLFLDSMQEEPVSEDLEEEAKRYATEGDEISGLYIIDEEVEAFKAGAKWQKEQMKKKSVDGTFSFGELADGTPIDSIFVLDKEARSKCKEGDKVKVIVIKENQ